MNAQSFIEFAAASPTAFHAAHAASEMLRGNGYAELAEHAPWTIVPGGKYFVTRNRSSIVAFAVPQTGFATAVVVSSHSDSPMFKLKPASEDAVLGHYVRLNVERYGGMIMSTWLDRPLSIAGRVLVRDGAKITSRLVDLGRDAVLIPNMPIHFNRQVNDGYAFNAQTDMLPLLGDASSKGALTEEIAGLLGVRPEAVVAGDLFLYNRTPGTVWGAHNEYFSCARIDNLECAFSSLHALLSAKCEHHINMLAIFDNEEVGSLSKQGADSTLLTDVYARIAQALGADDAAMRAAMAASFMASADNAHAVNPNHPEKFDAQNRCYMNEGVVIKHNANQKYTTDAVSRAVFEAVCEAAGVPVQHFSNRSDIPGGSTLGAIANAHWSMNTVDIGLAQLAMHSCYETAGCADLPMMVKAMTRLYETDIHMTADGDFSLNL